MEKRLTQYTENSFISLCGLARKILAYHNFVWEFLNESDFI